MPPDAIRFADDGCQLTCYADCEYGTIHCRNRHRPNRKPDWHDPERCDREVYG